MSCDIAPLPVGAAEALAPLHGACFPEDPWDAQALDRVLALLGAFGFLAWEADLPVGFALARDLGGEVEILTIGVTPASRRRGVGRALLRAILDRARHQSIASVVLEVAADNAAARRLYAAAGFVTVGRRPRYYRRGQETVDALLLRRRIAAHSADV